MSVEAGIFDPIKSLLRIIGKRDSRNALVLIMAKIEEFKYRLSEIKRKLKDRDAQLYAAAVRAYSEGDKERAAILASEVVEVRKYLKMVSVAELAIEKVLERLRTLDIVKDLVSLGTVIGVLDELKNRFAPLAPYLAQTLSEMINHINTLVTATQSPSTPTASAIVRTSEVEKIMKEIEEQVEKKLSASLAPLPKELEASVSEIKSKSMNVAAPVSSILAPMLIPNEPVVEAQPASYRPKALSPAEIDEKVYNYIVKSNGVIDIDACAKELGVSREEVLASLKRLEARGLIKLQP